MVTLWPVLVVNVIPLLEEPLLTALELLLGAAGGAKAEDGGGGGGGSVDGRRNWSLPAPAPTGGAGGAELGGGGSGREPPPTGGSGAMGREVEYMGW